MSRRDPTDAELDARHAELLAEVEADPNAFVPVMRPRTAEQRRLDAEAEREIVRLFCGGEPVRLAEELQRVDLAELVEAAEPGPSGPN